MTCRSEIEIVRRSNLEWSQIIYSLDDPAEADQFRFVEAMEYLIRPAYDPVDIRAFSFTLAMYTRDIREFHLEKVNEYEDMFLWN